jgi:5-methylcytosine-specific restriction endonuclease McrA
VAKRRAGRCSYCSVSFTSVRRSDRSWTRCCSRTCAQMLRLREQGRQPGLDPEVRRASWRAKNHRRRVKCRAEFDEVTADFERNLRTQTRRCPLCKVWMTSKPYLPNSKELDHIVPRNAGGTHTLGNVRIICRTCNIGRPKDGSDYTGPVTLWALAEAG